MILGIEASNIRVGGGIIHLKELLNNMDLKTSRFNRIIVWGGRVTLEELPKKDGVDYQYVKMLDKSFVHRTYWQRIKASKVARDHNCDVLFLLGATPVKFRKTVSFCQNQLPFDEYEKRRYSGFNLWRYNTLKKQQLKSFKAAKKVIFLTQSSLDGLKEHMPKIKDKAVIIPHGLNPRFIDTSKNYEIAGKIKIFYVSIINFYKHQKEVVQAVLLLKEKGINVSLTLVGAAYKPALNELKSLLGDNLDEVDGIKYIPKLPYDELHETYKASDIFLFASSCETFGMILIEAMAASLPIAASNKSCIPELLKDAGVYFNPEVPEEIVEACEKLINNESLRKVMGEKAHNYALDYQWSKCATHTLQVLEEVASSEL